MHYSIKTDYRDICLHFTGIPFPKDISSSRSKQVGYSGTHLESHHLGGEAGRSRVQGQAGLHSKTLFQKKKKPQTDSPSFIPYSEQGKVQHVSNSISQMLRALNSSNLPRWQDPELSHGF
jgi:hypothetical protein